MWYKILSYYYCCKSEIAFCPRGEREREGKDKPNIVWLTIVTICALIRILHSHNLIKFISSYYMNMNLIFDTVKLSFVKC